MKAKTLQCKLCWNQRKQVIKRVEITRLRAMKQRASWQKIAQHLAEKKPCRHRNRGRGGESLGRGGGGPHTVWGLEKQRGGRLRQSESRHRLSPSQVTRLQDVSMEIVRAGRLHERYSRLWRWHWGQLLLLQWNHRRGNTRTWVFNLFVWLNDRFFLWICSFVGREGKAGHRFTSSVSKSAAGEQQITKSCVG